MFTGIYCAERLGRIEAELQKKIFHHIKPPAHIPSVATVIWEYQLLPHRPYSSDMARCDFFRLQTWRKRLAQHKMKSSLLVRPTLQTSRKLIFFRRVKGVWSISGSSTFSFLFCRLGNWAILTVTIGANLYGQIAQ